jgi:hypothetical protein
MDFYQLDQHSLKSPSIQLLRSPNAALIISFLYGNFREEHLPAVEYTALRDALASASTSECWLHVNPSQSIGTARLIGYTTGSHLHYAVAIDRNNDGSFSTNNAVEDEDPLMAFQTIR